MLKFTKNRSIPLITFSEDISASAGYFIQCIGDKVYSHPDGLVGSIGALTTAFECKGLLEQLMIKPKSIHS